MRTIRRDALLVAGLVVLAAAVLGATLSASRAAFQAYGLDIALALVAIAALGFAWRTRQKQQADSRVACVAQHDTLTEILNRTRFMRDLDEAVALGCAVAVHCIDIDRFREINDTMGQATGDAMLQLMARRLVSVSGRSDLVARIGGDELALAQVIESPRQVTRTAERIRAVLGEIYRLPDHDVEASVSIGSAVAPAHGSSAAALLKNAEIALDHAKNEGFGSRALFRAEMDAELRERLRLESLLRNALSQDGFELHFQPFRSTKDARLAGFEALLRLPAPEGGHIPPTRFVPLAERLGLIGEIGEWVIRRACEVAVNWPAALTISVNLSPVQFHDGGIAATVKRALDASGLAPERLELEITEGLLLSHTDATMRQLRELKALGVKIAMDDFGTGYSSLSYLWRFPFDKLKIDQSFVHGLADGDKHLASVIEAIVALGRSLGMTLTAEGVETRDQAMFLARIGVDLLQGFYLGRPMPLDQLAATILADFREEHGEEPSPEAPRLRAIDG